MRAEYTFQLSNHTEDDRSVIEEAIESGTYWADSTDDAAFAAVSDEFRMHEAIEADGSSGCWLVRYEGQRYLADLRYGAFLEA